MLSVLILDTVIKLQPGAVWGGFGAVWVQKAKFCSGRRLRSRLCPAACSRRLPEDVDPAGNIAAAVTAREAGVGPALPA